MNHKAHTAITKLVQNNSVHTGKKKYVARSLNDDGDSKKKKKNLKLK